MTSFIRIFVVFIFLFSVVLGLLSPSCRKRSETCRASSDCCPVKGVRMVCAAHLEICGNKICCITEVEEQQEKQAAAFRPKSPKLKRVLERLFDEYNEEEENQ